MILEFRNVVKDYRGLRPLRIQQLELQEGRSVALVGFDQASAEVFVNLATGATVPDAGEVRVFGETTAAITDAHAWLASLDRFGIVSERAMLLEALTVIQNLAMPFTLEVNPVAEAVRVQVGKLADEVGLVAADLQRPVAELSPSAKLRVRLGRAVAMNPRILLAEHPNATLSPDDLPVFAADFAKLVAARGIASVTLTADRTFASAIADQVLTLQPATGELRPESGWRRWVPGLK